ncbi:hypothetical protein GWI33_005375 [Rhynchophorus ferrugineus]|uniref:Uncharacterized protein n=1 Tax=Rhynchophorus ferrugineus TaxID=354439 RepID=A0A834IJE2_RHYFE|nr:hypothetical protein GWI33_005375 [Rhynchophorus ferrugineus]
MHRDTVAVVPPPPSPRPAGLNENFQLRKLPGRIKRIYLAWRKFLLARTLGRNAPGPDKIRSGSGCENAEPSEGTKTFWPRRASLQVLFVARDFSLGALLALKGLRVTGACRVESARRRPRLNISF